MILVGDCKEQMAKMPDNSVDSIVTDPPYHLQSIVKRFGGKTARNTPAMNTTAGGVFARKAAGFMGKTWDGGDVAYNVEVWQEALRILKPGGHLLSFGGSRTYHRMACAIEDAGFEIRDQIMWVYGSGFPKSLNVGKAIDKAAGVEREVVGTKIASPKGIKVAEQRTDVGAGAFGGEAKEIDITAPATPEAKQWEGWGTALKPAHEPIVVARKPLDGTVANNILKHGVGGMNIDGCRVETSDNFDKVKDRTDMTGKLTIHHEGGNLEALEKLKTLGRFPANFIHDGSDEVLKLFPNTGKSTGGRIGKKAMGTVTNVPAGQYEAGDPGYGDSGSAARFFYCAKANKKERNAGLTSEPKQNHHPTVKPVALMRYLVRLVTPPNGIVFDPFLGSGTTAVAAILEGFEWSGCEITPEYLPIIEGRVAWATEEAAQPEMELF
jgi:site-specific DNA-methyltransferase (adenine-specific)